MKDLLEKVRKGELTPEQAEAELKKRGEAPEVPMGLGGVPERVGQVVQYTPPDEHPMAFIAIIGFTVLHILFGVLTVLWVLNRFDQREAALWAAMAFFTLGLILALYLKHFIPDEIVVKKRRWKYVPQKNEPWSVTK